MRTLALLTLLAALSTGCETFGSRICDRSTEANPEVTYTGGTVVDGVYMTSPWDGELLYFPGGMRYSLVHNLGLAPRSVQAYLSFDRYGTQDGGSLAQAAGNQVVITGVDTKRIEIANDSCVDYWLLVVATP
jgi:hypothetical protein